MSIPDFSTLLTDVLNGDHKAIVIWRKYAEGASFNEEEIAQAREKIAKLSQSHFFHKPSARQHSYALYLKACMYAYGLGVEKNVKEAIYLYKKAINEGNTYAMNDLAALHENGVKDCKREEDATKLHDKAIKLFDKAIALGNVSAMVNRAYMYLCEEGGDPAHKQAIHLYDKAIELGDACAMTHRAYMHFKGLGDEPNYSVATYLYDKAIELGQVQAMWHRGMMHEHGLGGARNYLEAIRLYDKASKEGLIEAQKALTSLQEKLGGKLKHEKDLRMGKRVVVEKQVEVANQIFIEKQPIEEDAAEKKLKEDLANYEATFNALLEKLRTTQESLNQKVDNNEYNAVIQSVNELYNTLATEMSNFFSDPNPSGEKLKKSYAQCIEAISTTEKEAAKHRGLQGHALISVLRVISGLLGAMAIVPVLLYKETSDYYQTFFAKPVTATAEKINEIKLEFNACKEEFEEQENRVSEEMRSLNM